MHHKANLRPSRFNTGEGFKKLKMKFEGRNYPYITGKTVTYVKKELYYQERGFILS